MKTIEIVLSKEASLPNLCASGFKSQFGREAGQTINYFENKEKVFDHSLKVREDLLERLRPSVRPSVLPR